MKYYSLTEINKRNATYNIIIGERSNGKTYAAMAQAVQRYMKDGSQFAYVRRWQEDLVGRRAGQLFSGHIENQFITKATDGKFNGVHYYSGKYFLCTYDDAGKPVYSDADVIGYTFALSAAEHNKSTSYPKIRSIIFDEFLTPHLYLPDEFVLFMNTVSTIVRRRDDVQIYMLANTVNKYSPYFIEMGLNHIQNMEQGTIDIYKYGDSKLTVAVEYCSSSEVKGKEQNSHYFAFNNPKLDMITGGAWELAMYPHLPYRYKPKDVLMAFYIEYFDNLFQCNVIQMGDSVFIYIHRKTTEIKEPEKELIYTLDVRPELNYNRSIFKPVTNIQKKISWFFQHDMVFYQDNDVGDTIANYLKECRRL